MAKAIDWDPFKPWSGTLRWADLFDGRVWEIRKGEDFQMSATTVAKMIREEHNRLYGVLLVKEDGDVVRVQRVPGMKDYKAEP